jgi:hypothetical protein
MVTLNMDSASLLRGLNDLDNRHLPQIKVWALNWTADDALKAVQDRMKVVFDRPTRFTLNAFQVWRATKATMEAAVQERPSVGARHYLKIQERGGPRPQTALERLRSEKVATARIIQAVIPVQGRFGGAKLDAHGNWSVGERNRVLSQLGAQRDSAANETARSRARNPGRARYFVPRQGLPHGVWRRDKPGDAPVMVASFTKAVPKYEGQLGFEGEVTRVYHERIGENLRRAFERAMATAR